VQNDHNILFSGFKNVFAPDHAHEEERSLFLQAFSEAFSEYGKEQLQKRSAHFMAQKLFDQFFIHNDSAFEEHLGVIARLLNPHVSLRMFFSKLFHNFLRLTMSRLSAKDDCWVSISEFAEQVENVLQLIDTKSKKTRSSESPLQKIEAKTILRSFEQIRENGERVILLNNYLGVPIRFSATVLKTMPNGVLIKANSIQLTAALLQQGVFVLQDEMFEYDLFAKVKLHQLHGENFLLLYEFEPLEKRIFNREAIRVHPNVPHSILLRAQEGGVQGKGRLMDVSIGGVALLIDSELELQMGDVVRLHFPDSLLGDSLELNAVLVFVSTYEKARRYHFKLKINAQQERKLGAYISLREKEIIKSLRDYLI
jgi:hypothetical protein